MQFKQIAASKSVFYESISNQIHTFNHDHNYLKRS
jgi:hypothetical protein